MPVKPHNGLLTHLICVGMPVHARSPPKPAGVASMGLESCKVTKMGC